MTQVYDRRELILERLESLLGGLTIPLLGDPNGAGTVSIVPGNIVRNRNELPAEKVPGLILLDADEARDPRQTMTPRGTIESRVPVMVVKMTPEIYVVLDTRSVANPNVGQDLNTARLTILRAVLGDGELQRLTGQNGNIVYDGTVTDLARNRLMKGQLGMSISFTYPLTPKEITGI